MQADVFMGRLSGLVQEVLSVYQRVRPESPPVRVPDAGVQSSLPAEWYEPLDGGIPAERA